MADFTIRPLSSNDKNWVAQFITKHWRSDLIFVHGVTYHPKNLPGFVAIQNGEKVGLITYYLRDNNCEIVSLNSIRESIGIGTALIETVKKVAYQTGCIRLWVITTNDNLNALRFYQKRGFVLVKIHKNAVDKARKFKPEIPLVSTEGIPIRDEIELEMVF